MSEMVDPMRGMAEIVEWLRRTIEGDKRAALKGYGQAWEVEPANRHHVRVRAAEDVEGAVGILVAMVVGGDAEHVARHDPRDTIARCDAELALLDDLLAEPHYVGDDLYYSCAAATRERDGGEIPNPSRRGDVCDCGRDERVERRVRLLASGYRHRDGWKDEWAV